MQAFKALIVCAYNDLVFHLSGTSKWHDSVVKVTDQAYIHLLYVYYVTLINWHWYKHLALFDLISDRAFHFKFQKVELWL